MLIDAHCHPQLSDFKDSYLDSWRENVLIASSTGFQDLLDLQELAQKYPHMRLSGGIHPWNIKDVFPTNDLKLISELVISQSSLSIGEIGLDCSRKYKPYFEIQKRVLQAFFILARDTLRPIILHAVKAHHDILSFLKYFPKQKILIHGFQGSSDLLNQYLRYEAYFGLSVINFQEQAKKIPLHRLFLESDGLCHLSQFEIAYHKLAQIKNRSNCKTEEQIEENYHFLFNDPS